MAILVYRNILGRRELLGKIEHGPGVDARFTYDKEFLVRTQGTGDLGISMRLPFDHTPYTAEEFNPFFQGMLPEGEVYSNLAKMYQVPHSDYLSILEHLGCESIGALTFVSERVRPDEYNPRYDTLDRSVLAAMNENPLRMATEIASSTHLSLAGAQSKVAWCLPEGLGAETAATDEWLIPRGTAPSTHIIKMSRRGEEDIAENELVCSLLSSACEIDTARVTRVPGLHGAIAIERFDRRWTGSADERFLLRLHQEDFCQALGLGPYLKYQPESVDADYPLMMANVIDEGSSNPIADRIELAKRLVFDFAIGNSDAHLKNHALLYNERWTDRRLTPMYDVICIPLTGYSSDMPFVIGTHRLLDDIDERDLLSIALDLGIDLDDFDHTVNEVLHGLESPNIAFPSAETEGMAGRILANAAPRLKVIRHLLG